MSNNQIRAAGNYHKEMNQHHKQNGHRTSNQTNPSAWMQAQRRSGFNLSTNLGRNHFTIEQHLAHHPVQTLQRETDRQRLSQDYYESRFSYGPISLTLQRADNRGYPSIQDPNTTGFTYPSVQAPQIVTNRPRLFTDAHDSDSHLFCQPVQHYDSRGYPATQDSTKRMKTEHGYLPSSCECPPPLPPPHYSSIDSPTHKVIWPPSATSFQTRQRVHSNDEGLSAVISDEKTIRDDSSATSSIDEHPRSLALPEDKSHLTALHCFVRRHCVYIFCAESHEVDVPRKGRKKPLALGQIGIGCVFCKGSSTKLKGCSYFPSSISGIYNATMIIQQRHFPVCPSVTKTTYCEYNKLKGLTARSASTKEYWISSAKKLGMVDTANGVFFRSMLNDGSNMANPQGASPEGSLTTANVNTPPVTSFRSLVEPSDRVFATEYSYFVMAQMTTTTFTEADRLGKRKGHKVGFPGLACKHCFGGNGSGRFFPLTLKTFSDVSKSLHVLRNHLVKCAKAPASLSAKVSRLYDQHYNDKGAAPFGSQKIFFDHVWRRLHPEMYDESGKPTHKLHSHHSRKESSSSADMGKFSQLANQQGRSFEIDSPDSQGEAEFNFGDSNEMPALPPLPPTTAAGAGLITNTNDYASEIDESIDETKHRGPAKKRYLNMHYHGNSEPYSDADVSVAMILANGMGKEGQL